MIAALVFIVLVGLVGFVAGTTYINIVLYNSQYCHAFGVNRMHTFGTDICMPVNYDSANKGQSSKYITGYSGDVGYLHHQYYTDSACSVEASLVVVKTWSKSDLGQCTVFATYYSSNVIIFETSSPLIPEKDGLARQ